MNSPLTESIYYILISLTNPMHGYGIMQNVKELSNDRVELGAGTLYGAITNLLDKGWIEIYSEETDSRKKKEYLITNLGKQVLKQEIERLKELLKNSDIVKGDL